MDLRKVKKLIELVEESGIAELEVTSGDESVRIAMATTGAAVVAQPQPLGAVTNAVGHSHSSASTGKQSQSLVAPMSGTYYRAPSPDASAYIEVGQQVSTGDVIGIIESMKMMHEIRAEEAGQVVEIPVANGTPVTTGDVLVSLS